LPDGAGLAEIVIEPVKGAGRAGSGSERVVAYFLAADRTPWASPDPTDVSVRIEYPDRDALPITLKPDATPGSPGRFVSAPGTYMVEPLMGELTATLAGRALSARFAAVR
jgi:hypothetical protein